MDLDVDRIRHVAELAELSLTEEEERVLAHDVGRILDYVAELEALDTSNVPPTAHVTAAPPTRSNDGWRPDVVAPCLSHDEALAAAPEVDHGGFAVPTFVE